MLRLLLPLRNHGRIVRIVRAARVRTRNLVLFFLCLISFRADGEAVTDEIGDVAGAAHIVTNTGSDLIHGAAPRGPVAVLLPHPDEKDAFGPFRSHAS